MSNQKSITSFLSFKKKFYDKKINTQKNKNIKGKKTTKSCKNENSGKSKKHKKQTNAQNIPATIKQILQQNAVTSIEVETQNNDSENNGATNVLVLEKQVKMLEKNLIHAKSLLRKTTQANLEKDITILQLKHEKFGTQTAGERIFESYVDKFDTSELKKIKSVGPGQRNDSCFLLKIMRCLYKSDERYKLRERSVEGHKYKGQSKLGISFEKKSLMKDMLVERLKVELGAKSNCSVEFSERVKCFKKLMNSAISNILQAERKNNRNVIVRGNCIYGFDHFSKFSMNFFMLDENSRGQRTNHSPLPLYQSAPSVPYMTQAPYQYSGPDGSNHWMNDTSQPVAPRYQSPIAVSTMAQQPHHHADPDGSYEQSTYQQQEHRHIFPFHRYFNNNDF